MGKIELLVMVALAAAMVVLLVKKWGMAEYMQVHGDRVTSRLFSCDLCMSFWAAVLVVIGVSFVTDDSSLFWIPFLSTPLTRMMV